MSEGLFVAFGADDILDPKAVLKSIALRATSGEALLKKPEKPCHADGYFRDTMCREAEEAHGGELSKRRGVHRLCSGR